MKRLILLAIVVASCTPPAHEPGNVRKFHPDNQAADIEDQLAQDAWEEDSLVRAGVIWEDTVSVD